MRNPILLKFFIILCHNVTSQVQEVVQNHGAYFVEHGVFVLLPCRSFVIEVFIVQQLVIRTLIRSPPHLWRHLWLILIVSNCKAKRKPCWGHAHLRHVQTHRFRLMLLWLHVNFLDALALGLLQSNLCLLHLLLLHSNCFPDVQPSDAISLRAVTGRVHVIRFV